MLLRTLQLLSLVTLTSFIIGCSTPPPVDHSAMKPLLQQKNYAAIEGNTGKYMSPFTSDGVAAEWVEKSINAKIGAGLGGMAGAYAGQKALEQVPFVGGILGQKIGKEMGRAAALQLAGGEEGLKDTSDLSFDDLNMMAGWMIANHGDHPRFNEVFDATKQIYPDLQQAYFQVLSTAHLPEPALATASSNPESITK